MATEDQIHALEFNERQKMEDEYALIQSQLGNGSSDNLSDEESVSQEPVCDYAGKGFVPVDDSMQFEPTVENCLHLNQLYQAVVSESIQRLEEILLVNKEKQKILQEDINLVVQKKKRISGISKSSRLKSLTVFTSPYFKDRRGFPQPPNEDMKMKAATYELEVNTRPPRAWTEGEIELLKTAVKDTALERALQPLMSRKEIILEKLHKKDNMDPQEVDDLHNRLDATEYELEQIKNMNLMSLCGYTDSSLDWMKIATIDFDGTRTPEECELLWTNLLHPDVNISKWTKCEDTMLKKLVKQHHTDWDLIAQRLENNRTSFQACERYQSRLNEALLKSKWSPEEDALLFEVVKSCKTGDYIPWHQVAYYMEGRTRTQVQRRWQFHLNPTMARGRWKENEDMLLLVGVVRHNYSWFRVAEFVDGRNGAQCRDRWINCLSPDVDLKTWTKQDDEKLMKLVNKKGAKWAEIAKQFSGKTDSMVSRRYQCLLKLDARENSDDSGDENWPKSYTSKQCLLYREKVYRKVVRIKNAVAKGKKHSEHSNPKEVLAALSECTTDELDQVVKKIKSYKSKTGRPTAKVTNMDQSYFDYFESVSNDMSLRGGRPIVEASLNEDEEPFPSLVSAQQKTLGFAESTNANDAPLPDVFTLPPTIHTMKAFKSLLLCRRQLQRNIQPKSNDYLEVLKAATSPERVYSPLKNSLDSQLHNIVTQKLDGKKVDKPASVIIEECVEHHCASDARFAKLAYQFISVFFWPAFLSTLPINEDNDYINSGKSPIGQKRKKKSRPISKKPLNPLRRKHLNSSRLVKKEVAEEQPTSSTKSEEPNEATGGEKRPLEDEDKSEELKNEKRRRPGRPKGYRLPKKTIPETVRRSSRRVKLIEKTNL